MQFTATIALGVLPLLVFGGAAVLRPAPAVVAKPVPIEGVRVIAMDTRTFSARWRPVYDIAPATVIREVPAPVVAAAAATAKPRPARIVKRASLRLDVCAKHGMRKVTYTVRGYQRWRCRK